jgi:hypothetical protein
VAGGDLVGHDAEALGHHAADEGGDGVEHSPVSSRRSFATDAT